eukprot:7791056-Pyramimonas_sp.AAC.1
MAVCGCAGLVSRHGPVSALQRGHAPVRRAAEQGCRGLKPEPACALSDGLGGWVFAAAAAELLWVLCLHETDHSRL